MKITCLTLCGLFSAVSSACAAATPLRPAFSARDFRFSTSFTDPETTINVNADLLNMEILQKMAKGKKGSLRMYRTAENPFSI